jgi:hypothetical protein
MFMGSIAPAYWAYYGVVVSTSYPIGNRANGKNNAGRRYKKPMLVKSMQYHLWIEQ